MACDGVHLLAREGVDSASEDFLVHFNAVNTEADAVDDGIVEVLHARCAEVSRHVTVDEDFLAKVTEVVNEVQFLAEYGVVLQFNVGTSATGLTAGTYPIASTDAVGTMHQCTGYDAQYGPDYSHAYTYSGDSYTNLWYMVSGQAVVTDNSIVVSALNSLGHHINVPLGAGSAVENVDANAAVEKFVRNGQVIIRRGDKEYNTLGAEL